MAAANSRLRGGDAGEKPAAPVRSQEQAAAPDSSSSQFRVPRLSVQSAPQNATVRAESARTRMGTVLVPGNGTNTVTNLNSVASLRTSAGLYDLDLIVFVTISLVWPAHAARATVTVTVLVSQLTDVTVTSD